MWVAVASPTGCLESEFEFGLASLEQDSGTVSVLTTLLQDLFAAFALTVFLRDFFAAFALTLLLRDLFAVFALTGDAFVAAWIGFIAFEPVLAASSGTFAFTDILTSMTLSASSGSISNFTEMA